MVEGNHSVRLGIKVIKITAMTSAIMNGTTPLNTSSRLICKDLPISATI
jgi:hypothetical protein